MIKCIKEQKEEQSIKERPFLNTAYNIAKQLAKEAIWSADGCCNWQGSAIEHVNGSYLMVNRTFKSDLYNGLSGIALFLAEFLAKKKDEILQLVLEGTIKNILLQSKTAPLECKLGLYSGQLGVGFTLWRIGILNNNIVWKEAGLNMVRSLKEEEISDIDVITGVAGAIAPLLKMHKAEQDDTFLKLAISFGEFLIKEASKNETSWTWKTMLSRPGLAGYSHGNAGIALAILELWQKTRDEKYYQAAFMGFQYERELFNKEANNWPDLRDCKEQKLYRSKDLYTKVMWCHGAAGIGLSRLAAYQMTSDLDFLQEIRIAMETTSKDIISQLNKSESINYSLCHGMAGNADILLSGGLLLNEMNYIQLAQQVGMLGIERYDKNGKAWPSGVNDPNGFSINENETPGLLLGLAGTGYFYLRLAFPDEIESVLLIR
ncbi:lanthionine synthetase LanC family protein [Olleya sp. HaHaR_3_96]|uniref:lanthionine synthetase LanC family protein n=1 Tax=Olleya sp. HaHaR_3_96 TaxID=2745560 RepID=UPI001C502248|nr:lanthionine synthetase LanC family protein [Olleya sp. HaHaR_3_96]QXP58984.1 hypothetical protein H0I26_13810 [Olleya sp. HaHaR_3_96]